MPPHPLSGRSPIGPLTLLTTTIVFAIAMPPAWSWAEPIDRVERVEVDGTTLHARIRGLDASNPYLLILHGGPGFSSHMFYQWGRRLEPMVNVVYLDQRGCGESERVRFARAFAPTAEEAQPFAMDNLVADIEAVRQHLEVDHWFVLGHSWGGMLGLEYVAAHPDRVSGYLHMDGLLSVPGAQEAILNAVVEQLTTAAEDPDAEEADRQRASRQRDAVTKVRAQPPSMARLQFAYGWALGQANLYFASDQAGRFAAFNRVIAEQVALYDVPLEALRPALEPPAAIGLANDYANRDCLDTLPKITCPTLVIHGRQDGVIPIAMAEQVRDGIDAARLVVLNDCGHFPFVEQPERTAEIVREFLLDPR